MKLTAESHARLERFFREHKGDPSLRLPVINFHDGIVSLLLLKLIGMRGITFGRHVLVAPRLIERRSDGRAYAPDFLLVHEAAHVLQYEERGWTRFLYGYLRGYFRALRAQPRWDVAGRRAAYLSIAEEREAREAEAAFLRMESSREERLGDEGAGVVADVEDETTRRQADP